MASPRNPTLIFDDFRALLTGLSLGGNLRGTPLSEEALPRFTADAELDVLDTTTLGPVGGPLQNIRRIMRVKRGVAVTSDRDTANKAVLTAERTILSEFRKPANRPGGCRNIRLLGFSREEKSAEVWLVVVDFEIEYAVSLA